MAKKKRKGDRVIHSQDGVAGWMSARSQATLNRLIVENDVRTVIEVGSFVGLSAAFFSPLVDRVYCIDHFQALQDDPLLVPYIERVGFTDQAANQYEAFLRNTLPLANVVGIKMSSAEASRLPLVADLVFIDAAHDYDSVAEDIALWTPHATKVLCGDDNLRIWPGVTQAATEIGADVSERIWWKCVMS